MRFNRKQSRFKLDFEDDKMKSTKKDIWEKYNFEWIYFAQNLSSDQVV